MAPRTRLTVASTSKPPTMRTRQTQRFSPEILEGLRDDLQSGRIPLERVAITDDIQDGLRAFIRPSGLITFHAHYDVDGQRPYIKIGHYPEPDEIKKNPKAAQEAIDDARRITNTIRALAKRGIDVQEGLHTRLIRELREQGEKWRP